jgi:hypothetical protein
LIADKNKSDFSKKLNISRRLPKILLISAFSSKTSYSIPLLKFVHDQHFAGKLELNVENNYIKLNISIDQLLKKGMENKS